MLALRDRRTGNCLIAGPISARSVDNCWSDPGPEIFATIFLLNFPLTILVVILMHARDGKDCGDKDGNYETAATVIDGKEFVDAITSTTQAIRRAAGCPPTARAASTA